MHYLLNLIRQQDSEELIDKIYLYAKDLNELKYQFLSQKRKDVGIKHLHDPKAFREYSNTMDDVYINIDNYTPNRNRKILIVFDDMIVDIMTKIKYISCIYHRISFFCSKRCKIKFYTLSNNEDS